MTRKEWRNLMVDKHAGHLRRPDLTPQMQRLSLSLYDHLGWSVRWQAQRTIRRSQLETNSIFK